MHPFQKALQKERDALQKRICLLDDLIQNYETLETIADPPPAGDMAVATNFDLRLPLRDLQLTEALERLLLDAAEPLSCAELTHRLITADYPLPVSHTPTRFRSRVYRTLQHMSADDEQIVKAKGKYQTYASAMTFRDVDLNPPNNAGLERQNPLHD